MSPKNERSFITEQLIKCYCSNETHRNLIIYTYIISNSTSYFFRTLLFEGDLAVISSRLNYKVEVPRLDTIGANQRFKQPICIIAGISII